MQRSQWYLAGGTALALQGGHRVSVDLDFFTNQDDFSSSKLVRRFDPKEWKTVSLREGTLYGTLLGAKVSFIAYPFFIPAQPFHHYGSLRILDTHDIAVMKIIAISQRGRKRDFFDLYWYIQNGEPLLDIVTRLKHQYPTVAHDYHHIMKSFVYFADAEEDPMPQIHFRASWKQVKAFFKKEAPKCAKELLRLK